MVNFRFWSNLPNKVLTLKVRKAGKPSAIRIGEAGTQFDREKLEAAYVQDPLVRAAIDLKTELVLHAGWHLEGDENSVSVVNEFLSNIGSIGGTVTWSEILEIIFKYQMIYGSCYIEKIYSGNGRKLIDLDFVDPKQMDYAYTRQGTVAVDDYGNPLGYVETLPSQFASAIENKIEPPPDVVLTGNQIFIPADKIVHFRYSSVGNGYFGKGLVEAIYDLVVQKKEAEVGYSNSLKRAGFPIKVMYVGDQMHPPTEEQLEDAAEIAKNVSESSVLATPYYNKLDILESRSNGVPREALEYFIEQQLIGLGVPSSLVSGEANRATTIRQEYIFLVSLKQFIDKTVSLINRKILGEFCELERISPVRIVWNEISIGELDSKANRLSKYVKTGALKPDEKLERYIRKIEKIDDD